MKQIIKKIFYHFGYDIQSRSTWYSHDVRRIKFLNDHHVSLVLDIGANEGQYAQSIRKAGYKNQIISFEPIKDVFDLLNQKVISDSQWQAMNIAIGDFDGYTEINISNLSQVSSILSATGLGDTDYWKGTRQQQVQVSKLDSLIDELNIKDHRVWLKVDTQGFEEQVLKGCQNLIKESIIILEIELSMRQLYSGEKLFPEMFMLILNMGFELVSMSPVYVDSVTGYVLQYDCIFIKKSILDLEGK